MKSTNVRHLNKLLCFLMCMIFVYLLCIGVCAQPESRCCLTIEFQHGSFPISNAAFQLYRIADMDGNGELSYSEHFSDLRLDAEALRNAAHDLYTRVEKQGIQPEKTLTTDDQGIASAANLAPGAFLLVGTPATVNGFVYYVDKQVIFLEKGTLTLRPKSTRLPLGMELISIKAVKLWDDRGYEGERPNAIVVRLLKDGKFVSSAMLSSTNGWSYTWNDLLPNANWTVQEDVPEGYKVTVRKTDHIFTLTNHRKEIPQTGHIWWPVLTAMCAGLVLIAVGVAVRGRGRNDA